DGSFGPVTYDALRSFQSQQGLTVDGIAGPATWTKLIALGLVPAKNSTPPPSGGGSTHPLEQYASQTLRVGSRGAAVTALQKALGGLTADGVFGAKTEVKVKEFQRVKELTADGVVVTNVWNALMGKAYTKTA